MLATLYQLGITPSNSRPRVSNDNPYAESLFKTLKYHPNYQIKGFKTLEEARKWVSLFVKWYKHEHHHSGLNFLTHIKGVVGFLNRSFKSVSSRTLEWSRNTELESARTSLFKSRQRTGTNEQKRSQGSR